MNLRLVFGQIFVPSFLKKKKLIGLFNTTADAFQCRAPDLKGLSFNECLKRYAIFTSNKAEESIRLANDLEVKNRLYKGAYILAQGLKKSFRVNSVDDVMKTAKLVYRILDIEFDNDQKGGVLINRCFFSSFYSIQACQIISSLDEGLLEGLSGGTFRFSQRITEGKECCRARLFFNRDRK
jgi:hypothetical protein